MLSRPAMLRAASHGHQQTPGMWRGCNVRPALCNASFGPAAPGPSPTLPPASMKKPDPIPFQETRHQLHNAIQMAAFAPFASVRVKEEIFGAVSKLAEVYIILLALRVVFSFLNISGSGEPYSTLCQLTDPYLNIFRGVIPSIGSWDVGPLLGVILLSLAVKQLRVVFF